VPTSAARKSSRSSRMAGISLLLADLCSVVVAVVSRELEPCPARRQVGYGIKMRGNEVPKIAEEGGSS
jgi:hypothetical protein